MTLQSTVRDFRLTPLSACLALALAGGVLTPALAGTVADAANVAAVTKTASGHRHAAVTRATRPQRMAQHGSAPGKAAPPGYVPKTTPVGSCADDGGPTTLRSLVTAATSGDTIDLSALTCSTITLADGAITTSLEDLTVIGPTARITIDAGNASRVVGFYGHGTLSVSNLNFANGSYIHYNGFGGGGCIASFGNLSVTNGAISNCYSSANHVYGGALNVFGSLNLVNSSVTGSTGKALVSIGVDATHAPKGSYYPLTVHGGGIYSGYGLTLSNSTISGNAAVVGDVGAGYYGYALGGGAFSDYYIPDLKQSPSAVRDSTITVSGSTIDNNSTSAGANAYADGGGIYLHHVSLAMSNSTVSGNSSGGFVGGIEGYSSTGMTLYNSTIAQNSGNIVGGVYIKYDYQFTVHSTIIAGNTATDTSEHAADLAEHDTTAGQLAGNSPRAVAGVPLITASNNLITSHDTEIVIPGTVLTVDPQLQPLADNGGPTRTHALAASSPAKNAGDNLSGLAFDQRGTGYPRQSGGTPDIGAFEIQAAVQPLPIRPVPTLSAWTLGALSLLLGLLGWRRRDLLARQRE